jgi:hypothetical protein
MLEGNPVGIVDLGIAPDACIPSDAACVLALPPVSMIDPLYNLHCVPHRIQYQFWGPKAKWTSDSGTLASELFVSSSLDGVGGPSSSLDIVAMAQRNAKVIPRGISPCAGLYRCLPAAAPIR